uniref:Uncharacterized protein n=1 Tax=Anguilla anguilla TaxID=7936 RepID=A0A0E9SGW9_ANGAN
MIKCQSLHLALDCEFREGRDIHSVPPASHLVSVDMATFTMLFCVLLSSFF